MTLQHRTKRTMLALNLAIGLSLLTTAQAEDKAAVEQMDSATAFDAGNYAALGQARFLGNAPSTELVTLPELSAEEMQMLAQRRSHQMKQGEPLQVGIARELGMVEANVLRAGSFDNAKQATFNFSVTSKGANAVRLGFALDDARIASAVTLRFGGINGDVFEVQGSELSDESVQWSPIVSGDVIRVEVSVADGYSLSQAGLKLIQLSHLDLDPASTQSAMAAKIGESDPCERDIVCRTSAPANFRSTADSVARMVFTKGGSSFLCTGTLLNNNNATRRHLFWSANHCISSQTVANTLQTYWFYEATTCGGLTASSRARTLSGGAFLRHNNTSRDTLLLELKSAPPAGAVYAAWSSSAITSTGTAIEGIHHPAGDAKMYSLGSITATSSSIDGLGPFYRVQWSTGVTEGGSSGSGLFTRTSAGVYQLRGGLYGGLSFCTNPTANDYYSRFSDVYTSTKPYLSP